VRRVLFVPLVLVLAWSHAKADGPISLDAPLPPERPRPAHVSGIRFEFQSTGAWMAFPGAPTRAESTYRLLDGTVVRRMDASSSSNGMTFECTVFAAERALGGSELDRLGNRVEELLEQSGNGEVVRSQSVWYRGLPGVDVEFHDRSVDRFVHTRVLVGRSRTYWLAIGGPRRLATTLATQRDSFFAGLEPTPGDAPSAFGNGQITDGRARWLYPPEGRFAVELPGDAARVDIRLALAEREYDGYRYSVVGGTPSARYDVIVLWFDGRSPADALTAFEAYVVGTSGSVRERRDVAREGHGARELVIDVAQTTRTAAIVVTDSRLYAVVHTSATSDAAALGTSRARFFATFRILGGE